MRFKVLATDYDGTIAEDGIVHAETVAALERLKASERRLVMVTGRELPDLTLVCPQLKMFDLVVAENGALLYNPATEEEVVLAPQPSEALVARLRADGVTDISVGRTVIATWKPHEVEAFQAIRDLGLELNIIFNKEAVMILPTGVNKATGLKCALERLGLEESAVVGVGDAENDHAFIKACGFGAAVANAIPSLKAEVAHVTQGARGAGVVELIDQLLADDLAGLIRREMPAPPGNGVSPS